MGRQSRFPNYHLLQFYQQEERRKKEQEEREKNNLSSPPLPKNKDLPQEA